MFKFFQKNQVPATNYSALDLDFHSHLLPGIDDGSPDVHTSCTLIQELQGVGFKKIITTPHVMAGMYPNTRDIILKQRDALATHFKAYGIKLDNFDAAAEYFIDESFAEQIHREPLLTLPGNRVLVEMSFFQPYPNLHKVMFDLQMKGYKPVLAHPERYRYYNTPESFEQVKEMGCEFQTNILSLAGYYNPAIQAAARTLLENNLIDFLATDMHHIRHAENLRQALGHKLVIQALQSGNIKNKELSTQDHA